MNKLGAACKRGRRQTIKFDKHAVGVYQHQNNLLVGHIPIELSSQIHYFFEADKGNFLGLKVIWKGGRDVFSLIQQKIAYSTKKSIAITLHKELRIKDEERKTATLRLQVRAKERGHQKDTITPVSITSSLPYFPALTLINAVIREGVYQREAFIIISSKLTRRLLESGV